MVPFRFVTVETEWQAAARQINECLYLCIHAIGEPEHLTLGLIVTEAKSLAPAFDATSDRALERLTLGTKPADESGERRIFEMLFDRRSMISYSVLNESYGTRPEASEKFTGKLFRVFSQSHLLEYTKRTTIASDGYPGTLQHFQIACQFHVVDVICTAPPRIRVGTWFTEEQVA
jgi:hypothetical protein